MRTRNRHAKRNNVILIIAAVLLAAATFWFSGSTTEAPEQTSRKNQQEKPTEATPETPKKIDLQPTVNAWTSRTSGNFGIVVYDPANKAIIASHQPDEQFFTASIYKLYVAYLSLMDFESGKQNPNEVILASQTRRECVYKMIHTSDSPCGETILNNIGSAQLTERLRTEFGFTNTNFPGFYTSSGDVVRLLSRLQAKEDLNESNTKFLLDAMKTQVYRTGLPAGIPEATVANKVGFDSPDLWVDTGIITLPGGRDYVVSIFGNGGVSSSKISDFGRTIYAELSKN
jgi:beta-lactamase class A